MSGSVFSRYEKKFLLPQKQPNRRSGQGRPGGENFSGGLRKVESEHAEIYAL